MIFKASRMSHIDLQKTMKMNQNEINIMNMNARDEEDELYYEEEDYEEEDNNDDADDQIHLGAIVLFVLIAMCLLWVPVPTISVLLIAAKIAKVYDESQSLVHVTGFVLFSTAVIYIMYNN